MAKRKRLSVPDPVAPADTAPAAISGWAGMRRPPAPIADVAGDAAAHAALQEVAGEMQAARTEGRLVQKVPLAAIDAEHLVRDRMVLDGEEMEALKRSLAARGQQTPVEIVALQDGRYGLISGWRRIEALRALGQTHVQALVRTPESADAAYLAMVEENEIRAGLSFYERARLAAEAARIGVFPDAAAAVASLFANASASKRSKILNFVALYGALDPVLRFPSAIPERLGLALAAALEADPQFAARLKDRLRKTPPADAAAERAALERALRKASAAPRAASKEMLARDIALEARPGRVVLSGKGVSDELVAALRAWIAARV